MSELMHYGMPRRSGRYPWGSGERPRQNRDLLSRVRELKAQNVSEKDIADGLGMSVQELRNRYSIASKAERQEKIDRAMALKDKGYSTTAIAKEMGLNESSVRGLLDSKLAERTQEINRISDVLREGVKDKTYIDIGAGTEHDPKLGGIKATKLKAAVQKLQDEEGYEVHNIQVDQLGTTHKTTIKVLAPPNTTYRDIKEHQDQIKTISDFEKDTGRTSLNLEPPKSLSSKRIQVVYAEEGGTEKDGVIELRRGVDDISLGKAQYAQVRIAVDDTDYIKGMAMYADDLPPGVDVRVNTNKHKGTPLINPDNKDKQVLKRMKDDPDNPFGASIKPEENLRMTQRHYIDKNGKEQQSVINVVNEEGDWGTWSKTLSSQFLSKQPKELVQKQLNLSYSEKMAEFDEIMSVTNPVVKQRLLTSFADDCDASAVHLKAAALPRQASHVILPIKNMKENEIYAPNYRDGEEVVLIRHPHGGTFEIPRLRVNNRQKDAKSVMANATDAVGINSKVAEQLSGADFDGDTVLVIPTNNIKVKTKAPLEGLKGFDPKEAYPGYDGMEKMKEKTKQTEMGKVSNLITDMTLKGADEDEIVRAVKHSMVVIDAQKHNLDYKKSYVDNGIKELKIKYQGVSSNGQPKGASTLISQAKSETRIPARKEYYKVDPKTGKKIFTDTNEKYFKNGKEVIVKTKTTKMEAVDDAFELSSGTKIETEYAKYANSMKALGNRARKESLSVKATPYSPSAARTYADEVASLNEKLNIAQKNAPRERQAQLIANKTYSMKLEDNPGMDADTKKKIKGQALESARARVGAHKERIDPTDREWEAIQMGAISPTKLKAILDNADLDVIKRRATPRIETRLSSAQTNKIKAMQNSGYTLREIADSIGVSTSTVTAVLNG